MPRIETVTILLKDKVYPLCKNMMLWWELGGTALQRTSSGLSTAPPQEEEANRIRSGSSVLHMLFLRLQVVQLHGVLLVACLDLHVNSEAANEFLLSDIFRIYLQI